MSDAMDNFNQRIIEEFRANAGVVGGPFTGAPMLLLTTIGAKSGVARTMPLVYLDDGDVIYIIASKAGAHSHPGWYYNLTANPRVTVEQGADEYEAIATEITGEERDTIYARQAALMPQFAEYQAGTTRKIPVVALRRA